MIDPVFISMITLMSIALACCTMVPSGSWPLRNILLSTIIAALATELTATYVSALDQLNSMVYNLFVPLEFLLILRLIHIFRPRWKIPLFVAAAIGLSSFIVTLFYYDPMEFLLIESAMIIALVLSIVLLAALWSLANTSVEPLYRVPEFWLFLGLLMYFGGMMPLVGMIRFMFVHDLELTSRLYTILPVLCMVRYALTAFACLLHRRPFRSWVHE